MNDNSMGSMYTLDITFNHQISVNKRSSFKNLPLHPKQKHHHNQESFFYDGN